jgi:hypothetical protein
MLPEVDSTLAATLVLVCKRPLLGHGKQRLAAKIGERQALQVAEHLLGCALEDLHSWSGPTVIAPDSSERFDWASALVPHARCVPQICGNLGERLNTLDQMLRAAGHRRLMFIGSDAPALRLDDYQMACTALREADTVLIAASDGGVVLMASNRPWPDLAGLPWSTDELGQALAAACRQAGHSVSTCGESFDIDEPRDLSRALVELADDQRPARLRLRQVMARLCEGAPV